MLIGLNGFATSGKTTAAKFFIKTGFIKLSFAKSLKDAIFILNPIINYDDGVNKFERYQDAVNFLGLDEAKKFMEIRRLLQVFGTEVARNLWGDEFWINVIHNQIINSKNKNIVIDDVRFPNEAKAIQKWGGKVVKISRNGVSSVNTHISDKGLPDDLVDLTINNNGTIEDLWSEMQRLFVTTEKDDMS